MGEQMPSLRKISDIYGVSQTTAKKVIERLAAEGLVEIKPRWGIVRQVIGVTEKSGQGR